MKKKRKEYIWPQVKQRIKQRNKTNKQTIYLLNRIQKSMAMGCVNNFDCTSGRCYHSTAKCIYHQKVSVQHSPLEIWALEHYVQNVKFATKAFFQLRDASYFQRSFDWSGSPQGPP